MALNPKLLRTLISSADVPVDAASFAVSFSDDAARLAQKYGDDILRMAPKAEQLPFKPTTAQLAERAKNNITKRQLSKQIPSTKHTKAGDALSELFDNFTSVKSLESVSDDLLDTPYTDKFGNAVWINSALPEMLSYRKNPQMEILEESARRRYIDPPKWALHTDSDLGRTFPVPIDDTFDYAESASLEDLYDYLKGAPLPDAPPRATYTDALEPAPKVHKYNFSSYNPYYEDSPLFPDGFASPDDFAKYYESMELGYIPSEFASSYYDNMHEGVDFDTMSEFWDAPHDPLYVLGPFDLGPPFNFGRPAPKAKATDKANSEKFFSNPMFWDDLWLK